MPSSGNSFLVGLTTIRPAGAYQGSARPQLGRIHAEKASDQKAATDKKKTFGGPVRLFSQFPPAAPPPPPSSYAASTAASRAKKLEEQLARKKKQRAAVARYHTTQPTKKKTSSEAYKVSARKSQQRTKTSATKQASSIKKTSQSKAEGRAAAPQTDSARTKEPAEPCAEGSAATPRTQTTSTTIAADQVAQDTTTSATRQQSQPARKTSSEAVVAPKKRRRADSTVFAASSRFSEFPSDLPDSFSPLRSVSDNEHDNPRPNNRVRITAPVPELAATASQCRCLSSYLFLHPSSELLSFRQSSILPNLLEALLGSLSETFLEAPLKAL